MDLAAGDAAIEKDGIRLEAVLAKELAVLNRSYYFLRLLSVPSLQALLRLRRRRRRLAPLPQGLSKWGRFYNV